MTDGDRYSKGLGRSFKAIRPRVCSELEPDSVRAGLIAEYILKLLRKAVPSLAEIFGRATEEINRPNMLFAPALFLLTEQRLEPHTLGLEHLLESVRKTFEKSGTPEDILSDLAHRATSSFVTLVDHQKITRTISHVDELLHSSRLSLKSNCT